MEITKNKIIVIKESAYKTIHTEMLNRKNSTDLTHCISTGTYGTIKQLKEKWSNRVHINRYISKRQKP